MKLDAFNRSTVSNDDNDAAGINIAKRHSDKHHGQQAIIASRSQRERSPPGVERATTSTAGAARMKMQIRKEPGSPRSRTRSQLKTAASKSRCCYRLRNLKSSHRLRIPD